MAFLSVLGYLLVLRRRNIRERELQDIRDALIAGPNNDFMVDDSSDYDFENYEEFLRYMIENGYLVVEPVRKQGDQKIKDSFVTVDDNSCPICMMEYREEKVLTLDCNHKFHSACIRDWNQAGTTCPVCRADIYP